MKRIVLVLVLALPLLAMGCRTPVFPGVAGEIRIDTATKKIGVGFDISLCDLLGIGDSLPWIFGRAFDYIEKSICTAPEVRLQ